MARNREYELRLTVNRDAAERLVSHRLIRPALRDRQVARMVSTYFDTPDSTLQRHRFGLRVRRSDNEVTHTLKRTGGSLVDRGEWESNEASQEPNIVWLRKTPLAPLLRETDVAGALGPRFTVDVTRTTFRLKHKRASIEGALDQGAIRTDGLSLPVSEFELEIKRGKTGAVLDLARTLARDLPLTLSLATKADRGYGVSDLTWGQPSESITPKLKKRMTVAKAFEAIIQTCLDSFLKNGALIRDERDTEAVHKSRIALRHLRAACQLFEPVLRRKRFAKLRKQIRWLSRRLGDARDADVFQENLFEANADQKDAPGAKSLALVMSAQRERAHKRLRAAMGSRRARLFYLDLLAFSTDGVRRKRRNARYRPFVRSALARRRKKLARQARGLVKQTPTEMHDVRKAAKMLRYDLDLFDNAPRLMPRKARRSLGRNLKVLQKSLGSIQDQEAVRDHLRSTVLAEFDVQQLSAGERRQAVLAAARIAASPVSRREHLRDASKAAKRL